MIADGSTVKQSHEEKDGESNGRMMSRGTDPSCMTGNVVQQTNKPRDDFYFDGKTSLV